MSYERTSSDKLTAYAAIQTGQARNARQTAEALFRPKPLAMSGDHVVKPITAAVTPQQGVRVPRILNVPKPDADSSQRPEQAAKPLPRASKKQVGGIPPSEHGRIRTLATYGMTIQQVAEVYEVAESEIEHIVSG